MDQFAEQQHVDHRRARRLDTAAARQSPFEHGKGGAAQMSAATSTDFVEPARFLAARRRWLQYRLACGHRGRQADAPAG